MTSVDAASAALGAAVAEVVTYPFCTLKTQIQCRTTISRNSLLQSIRSQNAAQGGFGWLYQGLGWAVLSQALTSSGKWFGYQYLNARNAALPWATLSEWQRRMANGIVSGVAISTVTHLIDFVRVHRQMGPGEPGRAMETSYRGFSKTLGKTVVGGATYLPIFEHLRTSYGWNVVNASLASSVVSLTLSAPFDYMKQRRIYGLSSVDQRRLNGYGWIRTVYTGWSLNLARVVPHFVVWMSVTEFVKSRVLLSGDVNDRDKSHKGDEPDLNRKPCGPCRVGECKQRNGKPTNRENPKAVQRERDNQT